MSSRVLIYPGAGKGAPPREPVLYGELEHVLPDGHFVVKLDHCHQLEAYLPTRAPGQHAGRLATTVEKLVCHPNNVRHATRPPPTTAPDPGMQGMTMEEIRNLMSPLPTMQVNMRCIERRVAEEMQEERKDSTTWFQEHMGRPSSKE